MGAGGARASSVIPGPSLVPIRVFGSTLNATTRVILLQFNCQVVICQRLRMLF